MSGPHDFCYECPQAYYEALVEAGDAFGSFGNGDWRGNSHSPMHPGSLNQPGYARAPTMNQAMYPTFGQPLPAYAADPRIPLGQHNAYSPVHPVMNFPQAAPASYSPRDPRLAQPAPLAPYAPVSMMAPPMPFQPYGQTSPLHSMYAQPSSYRYKSSRSQPAKRRRSYSTDSSDSEAAAEISKRILGSSDDPRELKKIMKDTRKKTQQSSKTKRKDVSPIVDVGRKTRRSGSYLDEFADLFPTQQKERKRRDRRRSVSPTFIVDTEEIPAANEPEYFNDRLDESPIPDRRSRMDTPDFEPPRRQKRKEHKREKQKRRRRSMSENPMDSRKRRAQLSTTVVQHTALVPAHPRRAALIRRTTEKEKVGEIREQRWDDAVIQTGKRQRLPPLDWRKGERYIRTPDGTVVGKTGYTKLVCDDTLGLTKSKKGQHPRESISEHDHREEVGSSRNSIAEHRSSRTRPAPKSRKPKPRRSSQSDLQDAVNEAFPIVPLESAETRPFLNAFDYLKKDDQGIFCLGKHRILHRVADRKWEDLVEEGGFRLCSSITTEDAFMAEIALEPGYAEAREPETLQAGQAIFGRVLQGAQNSIRLQIFGQSDERLSEEDEFYVEAGSTYLITNLSQDKTAVLTLVAFE